MLLVFDHRDVPEAGTQVPAGTVRPDEPPGEAVLREIWEETGLRDVHIVAFLGHTTFNLAPYRDEIQERFVYHVELRSAAPPEWVHYEMHDGLSEPTAFCLYWVPIDDASLELAAGEGQLLAKLRGSRA